MFENKIETPNTVTIAKTQNRPSSPRQFFQRLYGHLEHNSSEPFNSEEKGPSKSNSLSYVNRNSEVFISDDHNFQSDGDSYSSPDISVSDEHLNETNLKCNQNDKILKNSLPNYYENSEENFNKSYYNTPIYGTSNIPFGYQNDTQFSAGFSAFLARRKKKEGRQRRQRTTFSTEQTLRLEVEFHRNEYITRSRRFELAETLRLTDTQIKIWFQNRRAKDKRIEKAQIDQQYRNFVVANGFMTTIMGQTYPQSMITNISPANYYHQSNNLPSHPFNMQPEKVKPREINNTNLNFSIPAKDQNTYTTSIQPAQKLYKNVTTNNNETKQINAC